MRRIVLLLTLGAAVAAGMPAATAATTATPVDATTSFVGPGMRICAGGAPEQGTGRFTVEGINSDGTNTPDYALTKRLNFSGTDLSDEAAELAENCVDIPLAEGIYRVTPGKYLSANCFKGPHFGTDASKFKFDTKRRCQAFAHHFHTKHAADLAALETAPSSTLEVSEVVVTIKGTEITEVDAHIVPVGYPECTDQNPAFGTPAENPDRICKPTKVPLAS